MKKMRPAANGIRTIRHCIGALLWDFLVRKSFSTGSLEDWMISAHKASKLPGGKYAKWLTNNRDWAERNFQQMSEETCVAQNDPLWETGTLNDKECILYHCIRSSPYYPWDDTENANRLGLKFVENDNTFFTDDEHAVHESALSGHMVSCRRMAVDFRDPFWVIVDAVIRDNDHGKPCNWSKASVRVTDYELGVLCGDLQYFGFDVPSRFKDMLLRRLLITLQANVYAKQAVDTWLVFARRLGVVKDIRRVIGELIWAERAEWAKPT